MAADDDDWDDVRRRERRATDPAVAGDPTRSGTLGPLEYAVIGFEGDGSDGNIAKQAAAVIDSRVFGLVDAAIISKDVHGTVEAVELNDHTDPRLAGATPMLASLRGLFDDADLEAAATGLVAGTSALVILFEHRWVSDIERAIEAAGGFVISSHTVASEALERINAERDGQSPSR